jgi:uncharacterized membrane protein HdeD (DUF308 family)
MMFILFGILAIGWPGVTFVARFFAFSLFLLISGVFNLVHGITGIHHDHRYWFLSMAVGLFEIGVAAYILRHPGIGLAAFVLLIGFTFIVRGLFETIVAFDHVYSSAYRILLAIGGLLGVVAGMIIIHSPVAGSLAFTWILGLYAMFTGAINIALAVAIKELAELAGNRHTGHELD